MWLLEGIFQEDVEQTTLSEESKSLYEEYKTQYTSEHFDNGTIETGNTLMNNMKEEKKKWEEVITPINMIHNSRKTWKNIRNISSDPTSSIAPCLVSAKQVDHQLLINSRDTMSNKPKRPVPTAEESMVYPFSKEEYRRGIDALKNSKAVRIDDVLVEKLNNVGLKLTSGCLQCSTTALLTTRSQQYGVTRRSSPY